MQPVIALCFHSSVVKDVVAEALWLALFTVFACLQRTLRIERKLSLRGGIPFALRRKSGRLFIDVSLMKKKTKSFHDHFTRVSWRPRCAKECAERIPVSLTHR